MHFSYSENLDTNNLCQGDVLERTDRLNALLHEVHPAFERQDNIYFQVLTQSCDLVCDRVKTDYIAICPVRTLSSVLSKALPSYVRKAVGGVPIGTERDKATYKQFLERLFNNNEQGYFFLDSRDAPFAEDSCALTKLAISLKREHYQLCLEAKRLQLTDTFQAKLGWLVGNTFSRVGTVDYSADELTAKVAASLKTSTIWVPSDKERKAVLDRATQLGDGFKQDMVAQIIREIETPKERALKVVQRILDSETAIPAAAARDVIKKLRNDPELKQVFPK